MSTGVMNRLAAVGASAALSGALLFAAAGPAQAEPVTAPVALAASAQAVEPTSSPIGLATGAVTPASTAAVAPEYKRWCNRVWHKPSWFWYHGKRHFKPGYWTCGWKKPDRHWGR